MPLVDFFTCTAILDGGPTLGKEELFGRLLAVPAQELMESVRAEDGMTRREWSRCNDPQAMLAFLEGTGKLTKRKARLLAAAACRRIPDLMANQGWRLAVEAAERLVEGLPA